MAGYFHSDNWYRVEHLRPKLRSNVRIHRHRYRGEPWYVLQDAASGRTLRISLNSARLVELLDGQRNIDQAWKMLLSDTRSPPPRQDELIDVLSQAHAMDMLQVDLPPEVTRLAQRRATQDKARIKGQLTNLLSIKLPLIDPDRFLSQTLWLVKPLLSIPGLLMWLSMVSWAGVEVLMHWSDLTNNVHDRLLSMGNLLSIWMIYPIVKSLHELGHGYAVKALGGEVHELGVMFIYFTPVPYVDASAANAFPDKWQRAAVSAAGIMVELFLATIALAVWLSVEPGAIRSIAFNVMMVCGVSTVIFNGNPLMRYDGYFMLADIIEIPNLASRSSSYWMKLIQNKLYVVPISSDHPVQGREQAWLFAYQIASVSYRTFVSLSIALWLAAEFFFVGIAISLGILWSTVLKPLTQGIRYLMSDHRLYGRRKRAVMLTLATVISLAGCIALIPLPFRKTVEGVIWVPDDAQIRASGDGFIERTLASSGERIVNGQPVFVSVDRELSANVLKSEARVNELEIDYSMKAYTDRVAAAVTRDAIATESAELERLRERQSHLITRSKADGYLSVARSEDQAGRYVKKGELLGYVINQSPRVVRAVIEQDSIDLVRNHLISAQLRVAGRMDQAYGTHIVREVPAGMHDLPSPALSIAGGGEIAYDPQDPEHIKSLDRVFLFDFDLDRALDAAPIGTRVYLRLGFEPESLFEMTYRRIRQLFLTRLNI